MINHQKEYILLLLLPIYILAILVLSDPKLQGDEIRYVNHATNLTKGYFIDPDHPAIHVGPAYPLVLVPFIALDLPLIVPTLLNAILVFLGVRFFYRATRYYAENDNYALIAALCLGLYPPIFRWMPLLHYESLAVFLVCGFIYNFTMALNPNNKGNSPIVWSGVMLGSLMLTKYLFFYVTLCVLISLTCIWLWKKDTVLRQSLIIFVFSLIIFSPYLIYTYNLTGKPFLAGTNGGEVLYHRTTPYPSELGNWFESHYILTDDKNDTYFDLDQLRKNHREFYQKIENLSPIERDSAFKAVAIQNIKSNPAKYIKNSIANVGRFLFHYPFSYRAHSLQTFGYLLPNMFLITICLLCIYPAVRNLKSIPLSLLILLLLIIVYSSAICVLGGRGRHFIIVVPFILLFITFVTSNVIKISYRYSKE